MRKTILAAFLVLFFLEGLSQEKKIEEVFVTGKVMDLPYPKSNANITIITREQIEIAPAKSVEEVLSYYTGVDVRKRGANGIQTDIAMRGSNAEQVLLLINGLRINDAQTGHNSMNLPFDVSSVERIEVLKGPAARRFGQGAYAGVINIVTKPSLENGLQVKLEGGDYNSYSAGVASDFGSNRFRNSIQVSQSASDGYRYNTDYHIQNIYYQNQYKIKEGSFGFQAGFQEKKFGANGFYASPSYTDQYEEVQVSIVSAALEKKLSKNLELQVKTYWKRAQDFYLLNRGQPNGYRNMHIGNNVGVDASTTYQSFLGKTGLGVEFRKEFLESNRLGSRARLVSQGFLEHHFAFFNENFRVSPGISWSNIEGKDYFYPGLDVSFTKDFHKIFTNFSKVNRIPTYTDLYYSSPVEQGNPNLVPENAWTGEVGYQYQKNQNYIKSSFFWRKTENAIDWQKDTQSSPWKALNIGALDTKGFELEAYHKVNNWFAYSLGYTYLDQQRLGSGVISRYSLDHLKHQFVARLITQYKGLVSELIYRYSDRLTLGSYNLLDAKVSYNFKKINLYALVNNITNTSYIETSLVPMPKRWFHVGFSYKFHWK